MATVARKSGLNFKWSKFFTSWYHPFVVYAIVLTLFFLLRLNGGNNPILLQLGPFQFRWYGVIITTGVVIAAFLGQFLAERRGDNPDHIWRLLPIVLVTGIGLARIWYVIFTWDSYKDYIFSVGNPQHAGVIEIWRGGIAIQGAVVGGTLGSLVYGWWVNRSGKTPGPRFSIWRWADYVAPGLILAQAMGRWGNFMNNEAYGRETHLPWGIKIPCTYRTTGLTPGTNDTSCPGIDQNALFHPTFLYESLWDYLCFSVLFWMIMKPKTFERRFRFRLRDGDVILTYWIIYSIGRFFTESLRTDSLYVTGTTSGLRSAQVTGIIGIIIASLIMFLRHRKPFPAHEALSVRLAPVVVAPVAATALADAPMRPDYKARVRPDAATTDESESDEVEDVDEAEETDEIEPVSADVDTEIEPQSSADEISPLPVLGLETTAANIQPADTVEAEPEQINQIETQAEAADANVEVGEPLVVDATNLQDQTNAAPVETEAAENIPVETQIEAGQISAAQQQPEVLVQPELAAATTVANVVEKPATAQPPPKTAGSNGASNVGSGSRRNDNKRRSGRR